MTPRLLAAALLLVGCMIDAGEPYADHSPLDAVLGDVVHDERVDYRAVRDRHHQELVGYLDRMAAIDPGRLGDQERLAYYINLYNATMIRAVVDRYRPDWSPAEDDFAIFAEPLVRTGGETISLDHLEKGILLREFDDARIHVALVCAAVSCPPLLPRAYTAADLDAVLERNMRRFLNDATRNRLDRESHVLELSKLFDWYADDFGGPEAVPAYVDAYVEPDVAGWPVTHLAYDWALNDVTDR